MRPIDADALLERSKSVYVEYIDDEDFEENCDDAFVVLAKHIKNAPTIDAVALDDVAKMIDDIFGCPCDYSPIDEWLPEVCELQDVCPSTEDGAECWKQYIKHYGERRK